MTPNLSFVIPAYNCAPFVADAIESIVAQRLDDVEIVVVDDASTDNTAEVLEGLAGRIGSRLRVERNERNLGGGFTRNRAIAAARSSLLYMVDSDNLLGPGCAVAALEHLAATDASMVSPAQSRYFRTSPADFFAVHDLPHRDGWSGWRELLETERGGPGNHGNYLFTRRSFDRVGGYDTDQEALDTWAFGVKQLAAGFRFAIAPGTFYFHRLRPDSYWLRQQRNNAQRAADRAIATLQRYAGSMPEDLAAKVGALRAGDPFFAVVGSGAFSELVELADFARIAASLRAEAGTRDPLPRRLFRRAASRLTRRAG